MALGWAFVINTRPLTNLQTNNDSMSLNIFRARHISKLLVVMIDVLQYIDVLYIHVDFEMMFCTFRDVNNEKTPSSMCWLPWIRLE